MLRAILRHVQFGLIASATLLVILAFQRLQLYSVPVLVGHIVHPSGHAGGAGMDSFDTSTSPGGDGGSRELVGHGHAHGRHRIFSTNVIEVGLFKFIVPFRWAASGVDRVDEEAVTMQRLKQYKERDGPPRPRRQQRQQVRRKSTKQSEDERAERNVDGFAGRRNRPRVRPRLSPDQMMIAPRLGQKTATVTRSQLLSNEGDASPKEGLEVGKPSDNATVSAVEPGGSPLFNATVSDGSDGANITALPARRLKRNTQRGVVESVWNRWWNG